MTPRRSTNGSKNSGERPIRAANGSASKKAKGSGVLPEKIRLPNAKMRRALRRDELRPNEIRDQAFRRVIRSIPKGKVASYGQVAAAAGYPLYHRAVARLLRNDPPNSLPWQRVLGAGGEIKLRLDGALEQRFRLELEGVTFSGKRVNVSKHQHKFRTWEL